MSESALAPRVRRVRRWLWACARLADAGDPLGRRAREVLPATTGLSRAGVAFALERCLENCPDDVQLDNLVRATPVARRAHVLLSANVFTAPVRAIALALAASERVSVRASRREPEFVELLAQASKGQFERVDTLRPASGDHVWAYGADATLAAFGDELPEGVVLHGHGFGYGIAVLDESAFSQGDALVGRLARALAFDTVAFDQRGCLSPRLVLVSASEQCAVRFARALTAALAELEQSVPRGRLSEDEAILGARFRDCLLVAGSYCTDGAWGSVAVLSRPRRWLLPPPGRHLLVLADVDVEQVLGALAPDVTQLGLACREALEVALAKCAPRARRAALGEMQRPPLDGPVDRRTQARVVVRHE